MKIVQANSVVQFVQENDTAQLDTIEALPTTVASQASQLSMNDETTSDDAADIVDDGAGASASENNNLGKFLRLFNFHKARSSCASVWPWVRA